MLEKSGDDHSGEDDHNELCIFGCFTNYRYYVNFQLPTVNSNLVFVTWKEHQFYAISWARDGDHVLSESIIFSIIQRKICVSDITKVFKLNLHLGEYLLRINMLWWKRIVTKEFHAFLTRAFFLKEYNFNIFLIKICFLFLAFLFIFCFLKENPKYYK